MPRPSANGHHPPPDAPPEPSARTDLAFDDMGLLLPRASGIVLAARLALATPDALGQLDAIGDALEAAQGLLRDAIARFDAWQGSRPR